MRDEVKVLVEKVFDYLSEYDIDRLKKVILLLKETDLDLEGLVEKHKINLSSLFTKTIDRNKKVEARKELKEEIENFINNHDLSENGKKIISILLEVM